MNSQRVKKTHKLFYNEYPYKINTKIKHASLLRSWSVDKVMLWCSLGTTNPYRYTKEPTPAERLELLNFCKLLATFDCNQYKGRVQGWNYSIFLKDKLLYQAMRSTLHSYITEVSEPETDNDLETLLSLKNIILCDDYPHGIYRFKVTLKPLSIAIGTNILEWAEKYSLDQLFISDATKSNINNANPIADPWLYVRDEKMLMMINFATAGFIRRCEEFIPRSSINIAIDQE